MNKLKLELALAIMSGRKGALHLLTADEMAVFGWGLRDQPQGYIWRNILSQCEGAIYEALMLFGHEHAEPVYASLEVTTPPRIVEYRTVINQDIVELDAAINALLADGWQPYMDQHARGPMVWQVMVKCATSGTETSEDKT